MEVERNDRNGNKTRLRMAPETRKLECWESKALTKLVVDLEKLGTVFEAFLIFESVCSFLSFIHFRFLFLSFIDLCLVLFFNDKGSICVFSAIFIQHFLFSHSLFMTFSLK